QPAPPSSVSASASSGALVEAPPPAPRCRVVEGAGATLLLGRVGKQAAAPEGDEADTEADDIALPFSPEVGTAAGFAGGFAVGALEPARGSTNAVVAIVSPALGLSRKV